MKRLYHAVLNLLHLGERRCAWCQKFLGWRFGLRGPATGDIMVTHGMCDPCADAFEAGITTGKQIVEQIRKRHPHRKLRKTLRRTTGGWGGAVARCGRVSR